MKLIQYFHCTATNFRVYSMAAKTKLFPNFDESLWLRSCTQEVAEPISGKITGTIPKWLNGDLIRNGPGALEIENNTFDHVFDSLALVRKFSLKDGDVTYQCKFLQSDAYKVTTTAKRIVSTGFGTKSVPDPCQSIFRRIASQFVSKKKVLFDNSVVSVYPFDDELYAFGEAPVIHRINQETLDTEERVNIHKHVAIVHHSAHPHVDKDGNVYNISLLKAENGVQHAVVCFPSKSKNDLGDHSMFEKANVVASIPARWSLNPAYMHSFGMTENYFIIIEQPWCISVPKTIMNRFLDQPFIKRLSTFKNEMTQFSIINRKTGEVKRFYSDTFFYFHVINQYELSGNIVLDLCAYKEPLGYDFFYVETLKNIQTNPNGADYFNGKPLRFIFPLMETVDNKHLEKDKNLIDVPNSEVEAHFSPDRKIIVKPETLCDIGCEMPRINYESYVGKEYRYFYSICLDVSVENPGMIIKTDTKNKSTVIWFEKDCFANEPIFVPAPDSKEEDDGVVLASVLWGGADTNRTGLVVLDAKTMKEIGRAEFVTPSPIARCFHGWFVPSKGFNQ